MFKLGKLPARKDSVSFKLSNYKEFLLAVPSKEPAVNLDWQMLGNDIYGDCVWAGAAHETMSWNHEAGKLITFSDSAVLGDYSAATGFNPADPNSDQGTDMQAAASYRRKTGVSDGVNRHKVLAYLAIKLGDYFELKQAIYLFGAVGIGFNFPDYAMDQFSAGQSWHLKSGGTIQGGHYVPAVGYNSTYIYVVSWGKLQRMTWGFYKKYADEAIAYVSSEFLTNGQSPEGINLASLEADLKAL